MLTINHVMIYLSLSFLYLFVMVYIVYLAVCFLFRCYGALQLIGCRRTSDNSPCIPTLDRYNTHHCPVMNDH